MASAIDPKTARILIITGLIVAVYFFFRDDIESALLRVIYGKQGDFERISKYEKEDVEELFRTAHGNIYGNYGVYTLALDTTAPMKNLAEIYKLNDSQFAYGVKFYNKFLSLNTSFYDDLDGEAIPQSDIDEKILTRISAMNLKV